MIKTVLFDLDGTLADTAIDLANALNAIRVLHNMSALPLKTIRPTVSLGGNAMIKLAFGLEENDVGFTEIRDQFLNHYRENIAAETVLFSGMEQVLNSLEENNIKWGIVTNKTSWLTEPLLKALSLDERCACVVSGDTTKERKPHPAPIIYACDLMKSEPGSTVYIGDAQRDIEAGRRAGTKTLIALYGYIDEDENPESWQADGMVTTPLEINDRLVELCK